MAENILDIALQLTDTTRQKISQLDEIMLRTQILAMNARLEAARAGDAGKSFAIVAKEMSVVSGEVNALSASLHKTIAENATRISEVGSEMTLAFRGSRFADLARNAVEIMDRNLYERSCDVRWWATDSAVVDVLEQPGAERIAHASSRLATILRSYTVYLDLWIADRHGRVVANGRPDRYPDVVGTNVSSSDWFRKGIATRDGDDFAVCDVERARLFGDAQVATYATAIRAGGDVSGQALGVLGIFFDWGPQAQTIVDSVSLSEDERRTAQVMLLDAKHRVIASSRPEAIGTHYPLRPQGPWGYYQTRDSQVAYGLTPGYETYRGLGWYGCIETPLAA
jgi:hypothetical protein